MCGIAGFLGVEGVGQAQLTEMLNSIYHRGPDDQAIYSDKNLYAGMNRLAINDLQHGGQPLFNGEKTVSLVYNGEIYNYPSLRKMLEDRGYVFRTKSDGEVICHLYDEFGESFCEYLDGMYALSLWDSIKEKLILGRDLIGEKPLYYAEIGSGLVFGSEIKALQQFKPLRLSLNYQAIWDFPTFLWIPEPQTIFNEIRALPAGSILIVENSALKLIKIRNRFEQRTNHRYGENGLIPEIRRVVEDAVDSRLLADVPVGCFLSGGLDSSIVTNLTVKKLGKIDTYSVGFESIVDPYHGKADESVHAANYAKVLGTRHHSIQMTAESCRSSLEDFIYFGDQPFAVSSGLGVLAIAKAAREDGIKVLLSGDCADECFGGYSWYSNLGINKPISINEFESDDTLSPVTFQSVGVPLKDRLDFISRLDGQNQAFSWHYYAHELEKKNLFSIDFMQEMKSSNRFFSNFKTSGDWNPIDFIKQDREFYLPQEMLRKVDRMTMAYSVEGRVPFAAPSIVALANCLSYDDMVKGQTLKWSLREAFSDVLPPEIIGREKHGFNIPIDHWLKVEWNDMVEETFRVGSALWRHKLIDEKSYKTAREMLFDQSKLNGHTIFCFIILNKWLEGLD